LPDAQLKGHDEPYEGRQWGVPAVFLGADASQRIRMVLGDDPGASATLTLRAQRKTVETRSLFAMLPGGSPERLVIESHTDGTNALEDNGPVDPRHRAVTRRVAQGLSSEDHGVRPVDGALLPAHRLAPVPPRRRRIAGAAPGRRIRPRPPSPASSSSSIWEYATTRHRRGHRRPGAS
jgi:hypothetical protein